jgi:anti-sigma regulatory factor (Ser/Thr protein kinase)
VADSRLIEASRGDHLAYFYGHEDELVDRIGRYVRRAFAAGAAVIVVASASHRRGLEADLTSHGIDPDAARAAGLLLVADAEETLGRFFVDGVIDGARFREVAGDLIRSASATGRAVCVYGEMVAILWQAGHVTATMALESLWNDLGRDHDFSVLCAYPAQAVGTDAQGEALARLRGWHSALISPVPSAARGSDVVTERSRTFPARADSPRAARHFVTTALKAWDVVGDRVDDAALVTSELASNALLHAKSDCVVTVSLTRNVIYIAVEDHAANLPRLRPPVGLESSGRGLSMVSAVSRRWGADLLGEGKVVWAELRRSGKRW